MYQGKQTHNGLQVQLHNTQTQAANLANLAEELCYSAHTPTDWFTGPPRLESHNRLVVKCALLCKFAKTLRPLLNNVYLASDTVLTLTFVLAPVYGRQLS